MTMVWTALAKRIGLAQRFFQKYEAEYAATSPAMLPSSPVSTAPEVYRDMPSTRSAAGRVNYLYDQVPHHQGQLPAGYDPNTEWLPFHVKVPAYLERGFPSRGPEDRPSTVYYSPGGERRELEVSSRSSHGAGPEFQLPEDDRKGPPASRNSERGLRPNRPEKSVPASSAKADRPPPEKRPARRDPQEHWGLGSPSHGLLAAETPYKKAEEFFVPRSPTGTRRETAVPGSDLPNPLQGLASAAPYGFPNDSISQAPIFRSKGKGVPRRSTATAARIQLEEVPEVDEESFHSTHRRDPPPHFAFDARGFPTGQEPRPEPETRARERGRSGSVPSRHAEESSRSPARRRTARPRTGRDDRDPSDGDDSSSDDEGSRRGRRPHPPRRRRSPSPNRPGPGSPSRPPGRGGGGGDSGGGGGGGGDGGDRSFPFVAPGAPYGTMVPTIEPKLKLESLPTWDGNYDTAVEYFWDVGQLASLLGWLPQALGFWLPSRLKAGSPVQRWFSIQSSARQADMRSHYMNYLRAIKERYLGKKWQLLMNIEYENQSFRQAGHERESPQSFLGRRVQWTRMLANADDGGPLEVFLVMRKAPIRWSAILVLENISSIEELYEKVNEHDESLVDAVRKDAPDVVTLKNLGAALKHLGWSSAEGGTSRRSHRANLTEADDSLGAGGG
ncbi:hypothetical protein B0H15DRAFT_951453 [Mycena belliarum]|uniref:Uncharacterized protein n=1 Tax=Mycena belliarum TaxID=1033014 RepID=A0AAD6TZI0_9AGAR|nr:hypothetical protein B0H15DRAFT_951453 [Mycena belliae]